MRKIDRLVGNSSLFYKCISKYDVPSTKVQEVFQMVQSAFDCLREGYRMPAEWEPMAATWLGWPVLK